MTALQIELLKLKKLANYIMLGLLLLLVVGVAAITFHQLNKMPEPPGVLLFWDMQASFVDLILAIFIIMNIGKEYSDNTLRRTIIDGMTRDGFFKSKVLLLLLSVVVFYIIPKIVLLTGGLISGHSSEVNAYLTVPVIITSFIKILAAGIFAFFLAFVTRSIALGIVFYFVWGNVVESILVMLEKFFTTWTFDLKNYLPVASVDAALNTNLAVEAQTIIIASGYLLIMLVVPYILLLKRDIK